jgi:hypothetical protein
MTELKYKLFEDIKTLTNEYKTNVNVFLMDKEQLSKNATIEFELILTLERLIRIAETNLIILRVNRKKSLSALKEFRGRPNERRRTKIYSKDKRNRGKR